MAARDVKIFRGDTLLGTHSLGEGEVVTVEKAVRQDQDPDLVNPPDVGEKQRVKVGQVTDFIVKIGVPDKKAPSAKAPTGVKRAVKRVTRKPAKRRTAKRAASKKTTAKK